MRSISAVVLAASLLVSNAYAASVPAPLTPGKPAGVQHAQMNGSNTLFIALGVGAAKETEDQLIVAMTRVGSDKISPDTFSAMQGFITDLRSQKALGRISIAADPSVLAAHPDLDPLLEPGDVIYIPQRPSTVSVLGQVRQPGSYPFRSRATIGDYIARAGGYSPTAETSGAYIVLPDGSARKMETSWLSFTSADLPPGSAIVVPRDVTPLDLRQIIIDTSQIFSQLAVSIASVAVISR